MGRVRTAARRVSKMDVVVQELGDALVNNEAVKTCTVATTVARGGRRKGV